MKQKLAITQTLTHRQLYHPAMADSLHILQSSPQDLKLYLWERSCANPFLRFTALSPQPHDPISLLTRREDLTQTIFSQLPYCKEAPDEELCAYLLSRLNSNGYFSIDMNQLIKQSRYTKTAIEHALYALRRMEPVGCFCFCLRECLQVQCELSEEAPSETGEILCDYLPQIAAGDLDAIHAATGLPKEEIDEGIRFIRTLNPKPAANYAVNASYLQAEAEIRVIEGKLHIALMKQDFRLELQKPDPQMMATQEELKRLRQEASALIDHVARRNLTMLSILQTLCSLQKEWFFSEGQAPLAYCTLQMVSEGCRLHPSTISRAIDNKSFLFLQREYPIAYLLRHDGSSALGAKDIMTLLTRIIAKEDSAHPYSDSTLCMLLKKEGVSLSRRTIAKYREAAGLPCSSKRRRR